MNNSVTPLIPKPRSVDLPHKIPFSIKIFSLPSFSEEQKRRGRSKKFNGERRSSEERDGGGDRQRQRQQTSFEMDNRSPSEQRPSRYSASR